MRAFFAFLIAISSYLLCSCAGYRWGGQKTGNLSGIESIYVPLAKTRVIFPRIEPLATSIVVDALVNDGTYQIGAATNADATLKLTVDSIEYVQTKSSREDVLRSEELEFSVLMSFELIDARHPQTPLETGKVRGETRFFVGGNQQTARANALQYAIGHAATNLVLELSDRL